MNKTRIRQAWARTAALLLFAVLTTTTAMADRTPPESHIDFCKGGLGEVIVQGWAYDRGGDLKICVRVYTSLDEEAEDFNQTQVDMSDEYDDATYFEHFQVDGVSSQNVSGNYGFRVRIPVSDFFIDLDVTKTLYVEIYAKTWQYNESNPYHDDYLFQLNSPYTAVTVSTDAGGVGSEESPYYIVDATHWDAIADILADTDIGQYYNTRHYQLYDDYNQWNEEYDSTTPVTKMWGTSSLPFAGHFDGNGQTLNVNISSTEEVVAPFAYVTWASIHDLTVTGSVNGSMYAGGIVGQAKSIIVDGSIVGGTIGRTVLQMNRCIYDGTISGFKNFAGGLIGWCGDLALEMRNCLFKGSFSPGDDGKYHPIACKNDTATVTAPPIVDVYYLRTAAPSEGLGDNTFNGAAGIPVSRDLIDGEWDSPVMLLDGEIYYRQHEDLENDIWDAVTRTLYVNSIPLNHRYSFNSFVEHLVIGSDVTALLEDAFMDCYSLKTVTFEEGSQLEVIGKNAFLGCKALTEITLPASVRSIGDYAFIHCSSLTSFTVPEGSQLERLGHCSFVSCGSLTSVIILSPTPPELFDNTFDNFQNIEFYGHGSAYKTATNWAGLYENWGLVTILHKLTTGQDVIVISPPDFSLKGYNYYSEGSVIIAPGNYTVTDADGNDVTASVLNGSKLTMNSCDLTVTGKSEVQDDLTIGTADEWNAFVSKVNSGISYIGSTVTLAADIDVSTMVGTAEHPFSGTFDGNGHTLNVSISSTDSYAAPFSHIDMAKIKNLSVTGSVTSSGNYAAGLVGRCITMNVITDCTVATTVSGAPYAGGIVGHGGSDKLTLERCIFSGTVSGFINYAGGILGWCDDLTLVINNCLMLGTLTPEEPGKCHPIACKNGASTVNASVAYTYYLYTAAPTATDDNIVPAPKCRPVSATLDAGIWDEPMMGADGNTYYAAHVTGVSTYFYGFENQDLAGEGWTLEPSYAGSSIVFHSNLPYEGSYFFGFVSSSYYQYLISPKIDNVTDTKVSFYYMYYTKSNDEFQVGYSTTNSEINSFKWKGNLPMTSDMNWHLYSIVLPFNVKYVAFRFKGRDAAILDNFIFGTYYGPEPQNLAVNDVRERDATLTWTYPDATAMAFIYQYKKATDNTWSEEIQTTSMSVSLSGLTSDTEYVFRVRALFTGDHSSSYTTIRFKTVLKTITVPYTDSFEENTDYWHTSNMNANSGFTSNEKRTGEMSFNFSVRKYYPSQYLISPRIVENKPFKLSFYCKASHDNQSAILYRVGTTTSDTNRLSDYTWSKVKSIENEDWEEQVFVCPKGTKYVAIECQQGTLYIDDLSLTEILTLADNADNTSTIAAIADGLAHDVMLQDRTLYRHDWNTLCLPFSMDAAQIASSSLAYATIMELDATATKLSGSTLTLNFKDATGIEAGRPYIVKWLLPTKVIKNESDWNDFASAVNNGTESYAGKLVQLGADINVSTMAGTADHPFRGTFDGNGHTLNVSISGAEYAAPFRYIKGATIRNLKVTGSVNGGQYSAGIAGAALDGTNRIRDCWMAASVTSQNNNIGGILGHGTISATTISNCYMNGTLSGRGVGIFYGGGSDGGTHAIEICWANGTYHYDPISGGINLVKTDGGTVSVTNCQHNCDNDLVTQGTYEFHVSNGNDDYLYANFLGSQWILDNGYLTLKPSVVIDETDIQDPVLLGVTVNDASAPVETDCVDFIGSTSPVTLTANDRSVLYLGANNTLYYPNADMTVNACRAYFAVGNGGRPSDMDNSGTLTITDVALMINHILTAPTTSPYTAADVTALANAIIGKSAPQVTISLVDADGILLYQGVGSSDAR